MFMFITVGVSFMIVTGLALYGEGLGAGSWADRLFGWVIPLAGGSLALHQLHHLGMWWIVIFMIVHIYVAIREDIMSRQSIVSTMISGHRTFKDDDPE
jgi:Ni/Fe-hydrogenase 1 B-type cytochrome subunit